MRRPFGLSCLRCSCSHLLITMLKVIKDGTLNSQSLPPFFPYPYYNSRTSVCVFVCLSHYSSYLEDMPGVGLIMASHTAAVAPSSLPLPQATLLDAESWGGYFLASPNGAFNGTWRVSPSPWLLSPPRTFPPFWVFWSARGLVHTECRDSLPPIPNTQ